jgi:hypothetical protein
MPTLLTQLRATSTGISMAEAARRQASYGPATTLLYLAASEAAKRAFYRSAIRAD